MNKKIGRHGLSFFEEIIMEYLTNDGISLNFQSFGAGQPVILVEGFGGYQEIWQAQIDYLVEMNCRVITYDHRNHGKSQRTSRNLTISQLAKDLAGLIDYLQLKVPILIGHSMGASVCYAYIQKYGNVKAVMAIDQSPKMLNDSEWEYGFENFTSDNFEENISYPNKIHETLHGLNNRVAFSLNKVRSQYPFNRKENVELLKDHFKRDWRPSLINCEIPMTLVLAKESPYFDYHFGDYLVQNKKITSIVLDNCGHDIMAEIPEVFNQTLRHFIFTSRRN